MRMIPMLKVKESKTPVLDNSVRANKEPVKEKSFKSEYDKVKNNSEKVPSKERLEKKDENDKTPVVYKEKSKEEPSKDLKVIKQVISKITQTEISDTKKSKSVKKLISKRTDKNIEIKNKSESRVKETDKNTLNQSIASSLNVQKPVEQKAEIKDKPQNEVNTVKDAKVKEVNEKINTPVNNLLSTKDVNIKDKSSDKELLAKKDKSKKSESKVKVADFRSELKKATDNGKAESVKANIDQNIASNSEVKTENIEQVESGADKTIVLGTTELSAEGDGGKAQAPVMKEASVLLKQQLKDFGNNDIVKQSRFILKDNNVGEIKLILKPEALGQVKINLNLNENSLAGQIVVENNSVKEVFQENINQLSRALEEEGFDSAKLDVSLNDKKGSDSQRKGENKQYFSERLKRFDNNGQVVRYGAPTAGINLTA